jgi:hypothetical protein
MHPDTVSVHAPGDEYDVEVHNEMENLTNTARTIEWVRTVLVNPDSLETQVCDPVACYAPWIDTRTFTLAADTTINMIVHLLNPESIEPYYAVVQLTYNDLTTPGNSETSIYIFNIGVLGTNDQLPAANVKLFPNPVVESFSLDNADDVHRILVFSADGRQIATFQPFAGQPYSLADQPAGAYAVALEAKNGKIFQAISIRKD